MEHLNSSFLQRMDFNKLINTAHEGNLQAMCDLMNMNTDSFSNTVEEIHPMFLSSMANASDNPRWEEAMNGPLREGYWEACEKEMNTLIEKECWELVDRNEIEHREDINLLPSTWAFKCKRFPDGLVRKLKARFCARGDKQIENIDYFETFAPVVNWTTVRLL